MKTYKINQTAETMIVSNRETGVRLAEYRLAPGCERTEIVQMRQAIDRHMDNGGTLGNDQW